MKWEMVGGILRFGISGVSSGESIILLIAIIKIHISDISAYHI